MEKKTRNDENIRQVIDTLTAANYHCGKVFHAAYKHPGKIELWVGPGRIPVIALQYYGNDDGFEVLAPMTHSNRMDETLSALEIATGASVKV
jgi:hypothetical protein